MNDIRQHDKSQLEEMLGKFLNILHMKRINHQAEKKCLKEIYSIRNTIRNNPLFIYRDQFLRNQLCRNLNVNIDNTSGLLHMILRLEELDSLLNTVLENSEQFRCNRGDFQKDSLVRSINDTLALLLKFNVGWERLLIEAAEADRRRFARSSGEEEEGSLNAFIMPLPGVGGGGGRGGGGGCIIPIIVVIFILLLIGISLLT